MPPTAGRRSWIGCGVMDLESFRNWLERYFAAWGSNEPDDVAALFAEDAEYWW
jgi:hypothetical protein